MAAGSARAGADWALYACLRRRSVAFDLTFLAIVSVGGAAASLTKLVFRSAPNDAPLRRGTGASGLGAGAEAGYPRKGEQGDGAVLCTAASRANQRRRIEGVFSDVPMEGAAALGAALGAYVCRLGISTFRYYVP